MNSSDIMGILKTVLVIAGVIAGFWLYTKLIRFMAEKINDHWRQRSLKEINRTVNFYMFFGLVLVIAIEAAMMLYPASLSTSRPLMAPIFCLLVLLTTGYFVVQEIKEIRDVEGFGAFEDELEQKTTRKSLFKLFAVIMGLVFVLIIAVVILSGHGWQYIFIIVFYPVALLIGYGLAVLKFSGMGLLRESEFEYKHYEFQNSKELQDYKSLIKHDAPYIRRALAHKDFPVLLNLLNKYLQKDLPIEALALEKEITRIDISGRYAQKVQELFDRASIGHELKADNGKVLDEQSKREIDALEERYMEELSPVSTLALAEAYRKFGMSEIALMYYENVLMNWKRSPEARVARKAMTEMKQRPGGHRKDH